MRVLVVGGMNLDLLGWPGQPLLPRDSTPGRIVSRPGGVGRNIAARLAALGAEVSLLTVLGDDAWARLLTEACARDGIDLSLSLKTAYPSPCYLCVHDEQGDMLAGVNDMRALEALTPQALEARLPALAGFDGCVLTPGCADPFGPKALRATMGSVFRVPICQADSACQAVEQLNRQGWATIAAALDGQPFYQRGSLPDQLCVLIGNEGAGLTAQTLSLCTHRYRLPMRGGAESLNAAVAAAIFMYDLTRDLP